jgi:hypothetical protein
MVRRAPGEGERYQRFQGRTPEAPPLLLSEEQRITRKVLHHSTSGPGHLSNRRRKWLSYLGSNPPGHGIEPINPDTVSD